MRGEEVASSIETHVRESIERMVSEIRASIEDVRVVVDSQLKAALQSVQADVNAVNFTQHIQKSIADFEQALEEERPPAPPPAAAGADASRVKQALQTVERGKSQVDILNALLEACLQFGSRAALLILRGETFSGWKGVGFTASGGNDEMVKRFNAAPGLIPELDRVLRNEQVVLWDGANLATRLGVGAPAQAALVPMVIKDKVAAAVYVDATEVDAATFDAASIEILVFSTGLLIDTLAIRKKIPSPSLNEAQAPEPEPAPAPEPPASSETVAMSASSVREMMSGARPSFNVPAAEEFGTSTATQRPTPAPPPPPSTHEERPSTQYVPPAGIQRGGSGAGGAQSDEAKKHDEARRFARLLVSEIKLYNESKVDQGRKNKDIYERLKEDIDRSRQMYDERIGEDVRKSSNYFYDELVRILADGDASSLGL
ncbi:MAG TPA: hypothetical protein VG323_04345 [Thermoanaerobaculia bacterium]|nr:hypothetical protein [Thermoanaerobaculia bacterium]